MLKYKITLKLIFLTWCWYISHLKKYNYIGRGKGEKVRLELISSFDKCEGIFNFLSLSLLPFIFSITLVVG